CRNEQSGRPRDGFEAGLLIAGDPAETAPAPDRQEEFEPEIVRHLGQTLIVIPRRLPAFRCKGCVFPGREIRAEDPKFESVGAVQRQPARDGRIVTEQHAPSFRALRSGPLPRPARQAQTPASSANSIAISLKRGANCSKQSATSGSKWLPRPSTISATARSWSNDSL